MPPSNTTLDWPVPPEIIEPKPSDSRRAWGKLPYEQRYRQQRQHLLDAAARIASRKGYQGTRIADVVAEAGLSKGTFYEHYSSKEECFLDLYRRTNAAMIRAGIRAAEANFSKGAYATVLAVVRGLLGFVAQNPQLARALGPEMGTNPEIRSENAEHRERIAELLVVVASRLGTELQLEELRLSAKVLVHGVIAVLPELRRRRSEFDEELQTVARVGCRGLGLQDAESSD